MIDAKNGSSSLQLESNFKQANSLRAYGDLIFRRKWTIIIVFLVVNASTVIYNLTRPDIHVELGEEAKIKAASGAGGVRIIDPPIRPQKPISTNLQQILMTATLCGLALGLVVALAKDKFECSFRVEDEVILYFVNDEINNAGTDDHEQRQAIPSE